MTNSLVALNFNLAANIGCNLTTKVALDLELAFNVLTELDEIALF
jgi:hypothetical protein